MAAEIFVGAVTGYAVNKLLDEVLNRAKLVAHRGKNVALLCDYLITLQPLVDQISTVVGPDTPAHSCLQVLFKLLLGADKVVKEYNSLRKRDLLRIISNSRKLVDVTERIQKWLPTVAAAGWASNVQIADALDQFGVHISQALGEMRQELEIMRLGESTKDILDESRRRATSYGHHSALMTPDVAYEKIRAQAGPTSTANDSYGGTDGEVTSSSAAREPTPTIKVKDVEIGGDDLLQKAKMLLLSESDDKSESSESKWVAIWSMGGAGKTFTARRAYYDADIRSRFFGGTFWLTVGRDRSTFSLLQQLYSDITKSNKILPKEGAKERVMSELVKHKQVLLVLDDVWESTDLGSLDVVGEYSSGSRILVTTRKKDLLDAVFAKKLQIPMLSLKHSWELFCWHAFHGEANVPPFLERDARKIADECKGLPLALKVIGGTMAGKNNRWEWESALQKLQDADAISREHEQQLFHRLELSLEDLPRIHRSLLDCFYYFAAFPEDASVDVMELLGWWVGEGMVESHNAYGLLGFLIARSLIELEESHDLIRGYGYRLELSWVCKIHDVLRDVARYRLEKKEKVHEMQCLYKPGKELRRFPSEWMASRGRTGTAGPPLSVQRLSLMNNNIDELPAQPLIAPNLLVLLLGKNPKMQSPPKDFFSHLSHLTVLVMQYTGITEIPYEAFKNLKSLVLLDLSHCRRIKKIPRSIKYLENLKEFYLVECENLRTLPSEIRFLKSLETFKSSDTRVWQPKRPGMLDQLGWLGSATLQDVSSWTELKDLSLSADDQDTQSIASLPDEFDRSNQLTNLDLDLPGLLDFPIGSGLVGLKSLKLYSKKLISLPSEFKALSHLQELKLRGCRALSSLPALDELTELERLDISHCSGLTSLPDSFGRPGAFPSLILLDLSRGDNVQCKFPSLQPGAMPRLAILTMMGWTWLTELPESLQFLVNLRRLALSSCRQLTNLETAFVPGSFPHLQELILKGARKLDRLPKSLASNAKLVTLDLQDCPAGDFLPADLENREGLMIVKVRDKSRTPLR